MTEPHAWPESPEALDTLLNDTLYGDAHALRKQWQALMRKPLPQRLGDRRVQRFHKRLLEAQARFQQKRQAIPAITFPDSLPVSGRRDDIAELIAKHQVVILAGETGSGKTTQLPKICLQLGRGLRGLIGHTQPRRIAATTVATRIAEELGQPVGVSIGFQVRFSDQCGPSAAVKLMTDGILLAEIQSDPLLWRYDTLIIDEAHERSLNIDFLLGYLKKILPRRPDLKVIVTSATIDVDKFAAHFNGAPIIEVSGRTFPVEVLYRPWQGELDDQPQAIVNSIEEILTMPRRQSGDILVFLSGEREIRETALAIRRASFPHLEVLPLYARLSLADQQRVFQGHRGRRVVLATNVAETSITVPGIGYVIDPGYARISRYSTRTQVQRLPVEAISQASANQRAGRCGRVSDGVCIRLYEQEDFERRPEFTDAEILRTNLASVILQMLAMRAGDIRHFPFVDPPDSKLIRDGYKLLEELQAVNPGGELTDVGRRLANLPLDPRIGRMLLEADRLGCVRELQIIAAALTVQDPRERPAEKQQAADEQHRRFRDEHSDFVAYLNLWGYVEQQRQEHSQNQWRKQSGREFLSFMRLREWRELHHQLRLAVRHLGVRENQAPADYESIHKALLSGLLGNLGVKSDESKEWDYEGTRNRKFSIFPGSSQFKKRPKWIMAGEMLETSRLFAHTVARVEPQWAQALAGHLIKHHYYEPFYHRKTGQVLCYDRVTLYGLQLSDRERVNYGTINPADARAIFIRQALVEGGYAKAQRNRPGAFFKFNQDQIAEVQTLEAKARRTDILVDDDAIFAFYDERIPVDVANLAGFESWRKRAEKQEQDLLKIPRELLMQHTADTITEAQFPDSLTVEGMALPLSYHFEPGHPDDGVSLGVPASILHTLPKHRLEWLVPGMLREKCIVLFKSLPKQWRKKFVPVPHFVDRILPSLKPDNRPLYDALAEQLTRIMGEPVPASIWQRVVIDDYYLMNLQILDDDGRIIDRGRNIEVLQEYYKKHVQTGLQEAGAGLEKENLTEWNFGPLQESCNLKRGRVNVRAFPALVAEKSGVALRLLDNPREAEAETRSGVIALAATQLHQSVRYLEKTLLKNRDMALSVISLGKREEVVKDLIYAAIGKTCFPDNDLPRDAKQFQAAVEKGRADVVASAQAMEALLLQVLNDVVQIRKTIKSSRNALLLVTVAADVNDQINNLIYPGFLQQTPYEWLEQFPRYMKAIAIRLEKAAQNLPKDRQSTKVLAEFRRMHEERLKTAGYTAYLFNPDWQLFRWMLEELRVSLFAQPLKTRMPVSEKRLSRIWDDSQK